VQLLESVDCSKISPEFFTFLIRLFAGRNITNRQRPSVFTI
jgi:hypothetical protein